MRRYRITAHRHAHAHARDSSSADPHQPGFTRIVTLVCTMYVYYVRLFPPVRRDSGTQACYRVYLIKSSKITRQKTMADRLTKLPSHSQGDRRTLGELLQMHGCRQFGF
jgi:hypothetical protein